MKITNVYCAAEKGLLLLGVEWFYHKKTLYLSFYVPFFVIHVDVYV